MWSVSSQFCTHRELQEVGSNLMSAKVEWVGKRRENITKQEVYYIYTPIKFQYCELGFPDGDLSR